jgi:rod shape-determining protein MreD
MNYKYLKPFLYFIPAVILQLIVVPLIAIENVVPDLVTIVLVYFVLNLGQFYGTALGFAFGLLFDLVSGGVFGSAMLSKTMAGFLTGYFYNENKIEYNTQTYLFIAILFIIASIESVIFTALSSASPKALTVLLLTGGILPGLYSAAVSFPVVIFKRKSVIE